MATVKKCDACKAVYELPSPRPADYKKHPNGIKLLCFYGNQVYYSHKALDLCPRCMKKIQNILEPEEKKDGN